MDCLTVCERKWGRNFREEMTGSIGTTEDVALTDFPKDAARPEDRRKGNGRKPASKNAKEEG